MDTQKKILIIEDDIEIQDTYKQKLEPLGFQIIRALDGKEGVKFATTELPQLILLDIMLPSGMNGFDVLEQLKRDPTTASIPVIVLTNLEGEMKTAREIGATEYLIKANISIDQVVEKIKLHIQ